MEESWLVLGMLLDEPFECIAEAHEKGLVGGRFVKRLFLTLEASDKLCEAAGTRGALKPEGVLTALSETGKILPLFAIFATRGDSYLNRLILRWFKKRGLGEDRVRSLIKRHTESKVPKEVVEKVLNLSEEKERSKSKDKKGEEKKDRAQEGEATAEKSARKRDGESKSRRGRSGKSEG